jgi:hypothetical protein
MKHIDLYELRESYNAKRILLCFNGPFSQGLIEEIGSALRNHMQSEASASSSAMDVFAVYIEIAQNIQHYCAARGYSEAEASATVVIARDDDGRYMVVAGNIIDPSDSEALCQRIGSLAQMDKAQLKAAYKQQLRQPRDESSREGAGLGLIDIARKSSAPMTCSVHPVDAGERLFFSLRVVI